LEASVTCLWVMTCISSVFPAAMRLRAWRARSAAAVCEAQPHTLRGLRSTYAHRLHGLHTHHTHTHTSWTAAHQIQPVWFAQHHTHPEWSAQHTHPDWSAQHAYTHCVACAVTHAHTLRGLRSTTLPVCGRSV